MVTPLGKGAISSRQRTKGSAQTSQEKLEMEIEIPGDAGGVHSDRPDKTAFGVGGAEEESPTMESRGARHLSYLFREEQ